MNIPTRSKALFLSHGGGPLPLLGDSAHQAMVTSLENIARTIATPKAVVVVSAHWEAEVVRITGHPQPSIIYDYYGFPDAAYHIEYPAPGQSDLAAAIVDALVQHQIPAAVDEDRGFDHGLFVPLNIMYPSADIPCIQVSLQNRLDPALHIRIGEALAETLPADVLLIGSGFSCHNMAAFRASADRIDDQNHAFEQWLIDTCSNSTYDERERTRRLIDWEAAPGARYCHPREEHLLPLHVCYGLAKTACLAYEALTIMGKRASIYCW